VAFCNSCGAPLPAAAAFCEKCGSAVTPGAKPLSAPVSVPVGSPSPTTPAQQGKGLKTILIILGVVGGVVILGIVASVIVGLQIARRTHVRHEGNKVKVETPFGTVESNQDADEVARDLGVDVYPGARAIKNSGAIAAIGGMKTVTARFESDDPSDKVADFYKKKFPNANVSQSGGDHYAIVQTNSDGALTISITPRNGATQINIANVQKGGDRSQ
jgi:hypothetical protein